MKEVTPTHKVIDLMYHEDEGNIAFSGTYEQCRDFIENEPMSFTYEIVPIVKPEHRP